MKTFKEYLAEGKGDSPEIKGMRKKAIDMIMDMELTFTTGKKAGFKMSKSFPEFKKIVQRYINKIDYRIKGSEKQSYSPFWALQSLREALMKKMNYIEMDIPSDPKTREYPSYSIEDNKKVLSLTNKLYDLTQVLAGQSGL